MLTKEEKRSYLESVVVSMYSTDVDDNVMDDVAGQLYEPDVIFEDPIVRVQGKNQAQLVFLATAKRLFRASHILNLYLRDMSYVPSESVEQDNPVDDHGYLVNGVAEIRYEGLLGMPFVNVTLVHDLLLVVNPHTRRIKYHLDQWRVLDAVKQVMYLSSYFLNKKIDNILTLELDDPARAITQLPQAPIVSGLLARVQHAVSYVKVAVGYALLPVLQRCVSPTTRLHASAG